MFICLISRLHSTLLVDRIQTWYTIIYFSMEAHFVERLYLKKWYLIFSFLLSLYLVVVTILGFTSISKEALKPLEQIAHYILWFFVIELVVIFIQTKNMRKFFKEQWLSIIAVVSSISVTYLINAVTGIGSLTGLKALKGVKSMKSIKAMKSIKLFKATKGTKLAKSYKIGKKASKAAKEAESAKHTT